jgi:transcription elongation factor GreA
LSEAVAAVRNRRQQNTDRMFEQVGKPVETDIPVMTRATWERLSKELDRMQYELRNVLPKTIQKARELGDLRENAEYHSAKLKQANLSRQVASLQVRLARARFVEEAELKDGIVGLGSEVVLESETDLTTYWILGEGEHHLGENVISFQTPVARVLMNKAIGDEVELEVENGRRRYRIVSVERKLPPHAESQPENAL